MYIWKPNVTVQQSAVKRLRDNFPINAISTSRTETLAAVFGAWVPNKESNQENVPTCFFPGNWLRGIPTSSAFLIGKLTKKIWQESITSTFEKMFTLWITTYLGAKQAFPKTWQYPHFIQTITWSGKQSNVRYLHFRMPTTPQKNGSTLGRIPSINFGIQFRATAFVEVDLYPSDYSSKVATRK